MKGKHEKEKGGKVVLMLLELILMLSFVSTFSKRWIMFLIIEEERVISSSFLGTSAKCKMKN